MEPQCTLVPCYPTAPTRDIPIPECDDDEEEWDVNLEEDDAYPTPNSLINDIVPLSAIVTTKGELEAQN